VSTPSQHPGTLAPALTVVVVADSSVRARHLRRLLSGPGFVVAAEACTADDAETAVVRHNPDVVLLDLDPDSGGIEAIERIMGIRPTPIVVCGDAALHARDALAAGAVDVVGALDALPSSPQYVTALRRHLKVASRVRVITHPRNRLRITQGVQSRPAVDRTDSSIAEDGVRLVVIGASTGGPPALAMILAELPGDLAVPVLVVQHMADGFVESLASWLDGLSRLPVMMAQDGERLEPGNVYVAPAGKNTLVRGGLRVQLRDPVPGQFHVPGVDATFASAAEICRDRAVGVLLTGMGRDGAEGLRRMHKAGAHTIGQDEPTSVVWGMPAAAQALGAVVAELALPDIAAAIVEAVRGPAARRASLKEGPVSC
jgi:two-component system chemotaxis response regulator CheB